MDFAFFVVNFGYTKPEFDALTLREVAFIKKAWENKKVLDTSLAYTAVATATYNVHRGKRKARQLFSKSNTRELSPFRRKQLVEQAIAVHEREERIGLDWMRKIYTGR